MDIGAFSNDDFNIKDWINKILESLDSQPDKDGYVNSLVMKLQLYVQQVNSSVEETSSGVLGSLPRIFRETQLLQQEALGLREKMSVVKDEIAKIEKDTSLSINSLAKIDKVKSDLEQAKLSLHEADNWSVLANQVEESFETGDIEVIAKKIGSMQKSLSMLTTNLDYEDKKLQLEGLKNRLEALASPLLVQAFTTRNLDQSKIYVTIFSQISRLDQLEKYYKNCTRAHLTSEWQKVSSHSDDSLPSQLISFFDKLLTLFPDSHRTSSALFPHSTLSLTLEIYTELLSGLCKVFETQISVHLRQFPPSEQLNALLNLRQIFDNFSLNFSHSLDNITPKSSLPTLEFARAIYCPLVSFISKYTTYETAYLSHQLQNLLPAPSTPSELSEKIHQLALSVPRIYEMATESFKRCQVLTNFCFSGQLVMSLNHLLVNYLQSYSAVVSVISAGKSRGENWGLFQQCLTLLQVIGSLQLTINDLNRQLIALVTENNSKLLASTNNFTKFHLLLSTDGKLAPDFTDRSGHFDDVGAQVQKLSGNLYKATYDVIFGPIYSQLLVIKTLKWRMDDKMAADLPDYSFVPQEFITIIGQYLMTLPQHLEPFLLQDNPSLDYALKMADDKFNLEENGGFTGILLSIVAKDASQMFLDQILGICELDSGGCKQLAVDIDYLGNIFEELGLKLTENLQAVALLLRLGPEEYLEGSVGFNPRIVAAVRQMRNIPSG